MNEGSLDNLIPEFGDYTLETLLNEYRQDVSSSEAEPDVSGRSRQIVLEALGDTLSRHRTIQPQYESVTAPEFEPFPDYEPVVSIAHAPDDESAVTAGPAISPESSIAVEPAAAVESAIAVEPVSPEKSAADSEPVSEPLQDVAINEDQEPKQEELSDKNVGEPVEPAKEAEKPADEPGDAVNKPDQKRTGPIFHRRTAEVAEAPERSWEDTLRAPFIKFLATKAAKRALRDAEAASWPEPTDDCASPELTPKKAVKFYASQIAPLRVRCRIAVLLCLILAWISFDLPCFGLLGSSISVKASVCLVLELSVMMAALDIVSAGIRQVFDLYPGMEALACLAALFSCLDAVAIMCGKLTEMPFCLLGAVSLTVALWSERLTCIGTAVTLRTAAKSPSVLTAQENIVRSGGGLIRSQRSTEGFVRRTEEPDFSRTTYAVAAPIFLILSLVLAAVAAIGQFRYFLHFLSCLVCVSAAFSVFLCFSLPFLLTARRLHASGAAIGGWAGCRDIGKTRRIVITDYDLFPPGTMKLTGINIQEGAKVDKVISYTASLLSASGSGLSSVFADLMSRRKYPMVKVEDFLCHEGGGLSAYIHGEHVLVGSVGFMNLMGIRLPLSMDVKNAVCTALSEELIGVFNIEYVPVKSVQNALITLLDGRTQPVFAIRDFNVTPLLVSHLFNIPTDSFNFPSYRERYRITAVTSADKAPISAVLTRAGMVPVADAAEHGCKLWNAAIVNTVLSLACSAFGFFLLALLYLSGSYETANIVNVFIYLLVWALPVLLISLWQSR
jgi:hypothetical protein